jgi:DNA-binding response OmpR family regulator
MDNNSQFSILNSPLVLIVEDNADVLRLNGKWLEAAGFRTVGAKTLAETRKILETKSPDIVVLDILLPDGDGLAFLPEYRTLCDVPVLFCSSRNEDKDILRGLEAGGDDYIPKPYNVEILVARVKAMWRKEQGNREKMRLALAAETPEQVVGRGPLKLDVLASRAYMNGVDLLLTQKEFALLLLLIQNEGKTMSAESLYEKVWKAPMGGDKNTLQVTVSKLRKKMKPAGYDITVIRGQGYIFEDMGKYGY